MERNAKISTPSMNFVLNLRSQTLNFKQSLVMSIYRPFFQRPTLVKEIQNSIEKDESSSNVNCEGHESESHHPKNTLDKRRFSTKTFDSLLDEGWGYVKISFLYDKIRSAITSKHSERPIIYINGTEKQEQWFQWKAITGKEYIGSQIQSNVSRSDSGDYDFSRHLGLSGLSFIVQKMGNYHELLSSLNSDETKIDVNLENAIRKSANAYRLIFWNSDQRDMLTGNHRFVIFHQDYDAGKQ